MKTPPFLLSLFALVLISGVAFAAPAAKPAPLPPEKPVEAVTSETAPADAMPQIDQENLKQLIETLESDTARAEFLTNLKTLMDQQKAEEAKEQEELEPLTEAIGVRGLISDSVTGYQSFLDRHNLSGSFVNQAAGSVIVLMAALVLLIFEKRGIKKLMRVTDRLSMRLETSVRHLRFYVRIVNLIARLMLAGVTLYTLAKIWNIEMVDRIFESDAVRNVVSSAMTILLVIFLAAVVWESINLYLIHIMRKAQSRGQARATTLLPLIRNIAVAIFFGLFGLVLLSEFGINVTPLLAGAGVIGVAVGFGAQSFVKDFLTGFTIILEDVMRVGDVVNIAGLGGQVEKITLRKIQLRDYNGAVYTIPYSEIRTIQNLTKDFSFYVMDISVGYTSDLDKVVSVLNRLDEEMRADPAFAPKILAPLEIAGVDRFADSAVVIKARIKTPPIQQWSVGREFNRRMKIAFEREGIEIPFPQRTIHVKADDAIKDNPLVMQALANGEATD